MKIAIVILNWNGKKLLQEFLPSVVKYSDNNPIYIIDNNSNDNSIDFIINKYPNINVILNRSNLGYAKGYNEGLKNVKEEVYCLLNNDIEVTKGWLYPITEEFESDKSVVVVQPKILDYKNKHKFEHAGAAGGFIDYFGYPYCRGRIFDSLEKDCGQYDQDIDIFWGSGACFFIRKDIFEKLNGFDENFFSHMEEIDLCWRITNFNSDLKKRFLYKSKVYHLGGGSLDYKNPKKLYFNVRNHFYTVVKNTDISKLPYHFFGSLRLHIIRIFNLLLIFYYLFTFKFDFFKVLLKLFSSSEFNKNINKYLLLKKNNNYKNYYVIKSIIFNYLILKKRKYSELNKS
jgi:GT2 family glycosyltransferase